ncbi:MAG: metallophosphoesterase family protein [Pirellulales bacterium]
MKRLLLGAAATCLLVAAVAFSAAEAPRGELAIDVQDRNPWTNLALNNGPESFQFAIVTDRTGGHRDAVFRHAVEKLNLLQPEFVLSVGDLIEGGTEDLAEIRTQWEEFTSFVEQLQMPFFYVPGNHDISNLVMSEKWRERFGRRYFHFVYRDVLFLLLNSEDPPGQSGGRLSPEQVAYFKQALAANPDVRWTLVFLHKPMWTYDELPETGWLEIEDALADRPYTVFAGHKHRYERFVRNGRLYYMLATTGGSSEMRGPAYGEFDHVVWVTMQKEGPVLANLMVEGIFPEDVAAVAGPRPEEPQQPAQPKQPDKPVAATPSEPAEAP